jgi:hypothetical protein
MNGECCPENPQPVHNPSTIHPQLRPENAPNPIFRPENALLRPLCVVSGAKKRKENEEVLRGARGQPERLRGVRAGSLGGREVRR